MPIDSRSFSERGGAAILPAVRPQEGRVLIAVTSPRAGDGKSTVAAGIAGALARGGAAVRLVRLAGDAGADIDAETFRRVPGVRCDGVALSPEQLGPPGPLTLVEVADAGAAAALVRATAGGLLLLVTLDGEADDVTVRRIAQESGAGGVVVTAAPESAAVRLRRWAAELELRLIGMVPQDRLLAAPSLQEMADALEGRLTSPDEGREEAVEWIEIGPITAHPGSVHFARAGSRAIITRADRPDVAMTALETDAACLILTGGGRVLPYVVERAQAQETPLIQTTLSTREAMERLGALYTRGHFRGLRKIERAINLVETHLDLTALTPRLPVAGGGR